jgi:hypothetical protein
MTLEFSINTVYKNKPSREVVERGAKSWVQKTGGLFDLRQIIEQGHAFCPAAMNSAHRKNDSFKYADLLAVDVDDGLTKEQFLDHALASQAAFTYTTASHTEELHKYRVIFQLPERITDPNVYKQVTTSMIKRLGGDEACTDPCRLFYGNDKTEVFLWQPEQYLTKETISELIEEAQQRNMNVRLGRNSQDCSPIDIELARFCLQEVLDTQKDRKRFLRITAACATTAGDALFDDWTDWASKTHHGEGKNTYRIWNNKYFSDFAHWDITLGSLFFYATQDEPDWRSRLPSHLKQQNSSTLGIIGEKFCGYEHSAFLGDDEYEDYDPATETSSLFSPAAQEPEDSTVAVLETISDDPDWSGSVDYGHDEPDEPGTGRETLRNLDPNSKIGAMTTSLLRAYPNLRLNVMSQELEYGSFENPTKGHDFSTAYINASIGLEKTYEKTVIYDLAQVLGRQEQYHPVRRYLERCIAKVAPCSYFNSLATELLGVSNEGDQNPMLDDGHRLADHIIRRFLIGAVARVLEPGCRHDWMPILIGGQNLGKSTFFQYLTPPDINDPGAYPWVSTMQQGIEHIKDRPHTLHSGWIVVLDEAERYFKRKYTEELKNLVSVSVDRSARKYENERNFPRSFVLAGATNNTDFLCDPTGNRRFMPIVVQGVVDQVINGKPTGIKIIDLDRLKQDRDSIWAAAYSAYLDQPLHEFTSYELGKVRDYIDSFTKDNPIESKLSEILNSPSTPSDLTLAWLFEQMDVKVDRHQSMTGPVTDALKREGWSSSRKTVAGKRSRVWKKKH